jgi:hypothetical protein
MAKRQIEAEAARSLKGEWKIKDLPVSPQR